MKKIIHVVVIKSSNESVYNALTTRKGLANWWSTKVEFTNGVGGKIIFYFNEEFNPTMEINKLEKNSKVIWKCIGGADNWNNNIFSFNLNENSAGCQLMFIQDYANELSDEVYGVYNYNWAYYIESLRLYCETGKGRPFKY